MSSIRDIHNPWRDSLLPATFRGVEFHVEQDVRSAGRRIVLHEFPKRDDPYAEDMGRRARRFQVQAYLIGPFYFITKDRLIDALERDGPGQLTLPLSWHLAPINVAVEGYSHTTSRERGGFVSFELQFVEAGTQPFAPTVQETATMVQQQAGALETGTSSRLDKSLGEPTTGAATVSSSD